MKAAAAVLLISVLAPFAISQVCGAPEGQSPTHKGKVVACPGSLFGGYCSLSLSFLQCLEKTDAAIWINRGDVVVWKSDLADSGSLTGKVVTMRFDTFTEEFSDGVSKYLECPDKPLDPPHHRGPFDDPFGEKKSDKKDSIKKASIVHPDATPYTCFKHNITMVDSLLGDKLLDPHVIIGDGNPFMFKLDYDGKPLKERREAKTSKP